tara:strand:- start:9042 stop:10277 length:1236 start_codon:yes stop_codon:yes gene_type:complete
MSKYFIRLFFSFACIFLLSGLAFGQSKKDLQQKKKQLQEEIQYTNKLLQETEKSKKTTLNQLRQLNSKIKSREDLIFTMEQEIDLLEDSILIQISNVDSLEKDLVQLKDEYAKMIQNAYKNRSAYNKMMFLLAADNFNQAFKRLKYFQQYAQFRQNQAEKILAQKAEIDKQIKVLAAIKQSKEGLLQAKLNEKNLLAGEKSKQESTVNSLKGKEQQLKKELKQKEIAAQKITKAIEKIIAEEIRKAREEAAKKGKASEGFPLTPEAQKLSNSFVANKGMLPWPVSEGIITARFGQHPHPTLKGVTLQNNGIEISTTKENMGRAVYEGTVSKIIVIPNDGKAVMINHGQYFTVYFYFKEVFVSAGEKVSTKQNIGILMSDKDVNTSNLHLEIWKVTGKTPDKLNPEQWIYKK